MFSLLFVRTLCLFQPLLSFVLLFGFLLCCFDFPSPLLLFLGIHFITLGLFLSSFLSFSFFDLVHYHTWSFLFWPVRSGGSCLFLIDLFLFILLLFWSCCLVVLFDSYSLYYEEMWAEQADDMVFAVPERGIEYIPNIYIMIQLFKKTVYMANHD